MKKLISVLLTVCLMFALCAPVFAGGGGEETPTLTYDTVDSNVSVVKMYYCVSFRHVWLYFENLCDFEVPLGYVTLAPHECMSVGSLSYLRPNGPGTYYNAEAYFATSGTPSGTCSINMNLNHSELERVNEVIRSLNFYLFTFWNCGVFASLVWNSVSSSPILHFIFPALTMVEVLIAGGSFGTPVMADVPAERVYKQVSGGVEQANTGAFGYAPV